MCVVFDNLVVKGDEVVDGNENAFISWTEYYKEINAIIERTE